MEVINIRNVRPYFGKAKRGAGTTTQGYECGAHWYVYNELRTTNQPYMHVTTAVSPLEVALFSEAGGMEMTASGDDDDSDEVGCTVVWESVKEMERLLANEDWLFFIDQWVPVEASSKKQRRAFLKLRRLLTYELPQQIAEDPSTALGRPGVLQLVLFVLSAIEQQRVAK